MRTRTVHSGSARSSSAWRSRNIRKSIGTGRVASAADAQEVCKAIRDELGKLANPELAAGVRVLYGGSVNAKNVGEIVAQEDVDGALVGGASLDGEQFATLSAIAAGGPLP
jgi:triosephosphate isomerase